MHTLAILGEAAAVAGQGVHRRNAAVSIENDLTLPLCTMIDIPNGGQHLQVAGCKLQHQSKSSVPHMSRA